MLSGTHGLVLGVANQRSIAWGIAQAASAAGARVALTYQGERLQRNAEELAGQLAGGKAYSCDVGSDDQLDSLFETLGKDLGHLDWMVHSVAYAPKEELEGGYKDSRREGFRTALDVSAYSLAATSRRAAQLMAGRPGSILTLTYLGSKRVVPGYNVMGVAKAALEAGVRYLASDLGPVGVRVNAVSAGPIKTLAAAGIPGFRDMLHHHAQRSPMRRNTEVAEVADAAVFLLSTRSRGITGQVLYVDGGFSIMGM